MIQGILFSDSQKKKSVHVYIKVLERNCYLVKWKLVLIFRIAKLESCSIHMWLMFCCRFLWSGLWDQHQRMWTKPLSKWWELCRWHQQLYLHVWTYRVIFLNYDFVYVMNCVISINECEPNHCQNGCNNYTCMYG